jgi:hypothetical protein
MNVVKKDNSLNTYFLSNNKENATELSDIIADFPSVELAAYLINLFNTKSGILKQTNPQGLFNLFSLHFTSLLENLCLEGHQKKAEELLEAIKKLYFDYFDTLYSNKLEEFNLTNLKDIHSITCYMLWDLVVIPKPLVEKAIYILKELLARPFTMSQLSALHGLGHIIQYEASKNKLLKKFCYSIIQNYIVQCQQKDLLGYAKKILETHPGKVTMLTF